MKRIYVLLDIMATGNIPDVRKYLENFNDQNYSFTFAQNYFEYETQKFNDYHLKYALLDTQFVEQFETGLDYLGELERRINVLTKLGFRIVLSNLWEDADDFRRLYFITSMLTHCEVEKWYILSGQSSYFWYKMYFMHHEWKYRFSHNIKKYDFLYLNKRTRPLRVHLFNQLKETDILENSLYTWWDNKERVQLSPRYEFPHHANNYPRIGADQGIFYRQYEHTKVSLVTETAVDKKKPHNSFITEKIWKPIICEHPFVVLGYAGVLRELRDLGFQTYDRIWDEEYDEIKDNYQRSRAIVYLLSKIKNIDHVELYEETKDIRSHNRRHFFNEDKMREVVTRDIKRAFELN